MTLEFILPDMQEMSSSSFLLVKDKLYKWIIMICLILVIITLFLAHGHYSIDILSGLFFAYAIKSFGEKHLEMFDLGNRKKVSG